MQAIRGIANDFPRLQIFANLLTIYIS